MAITSSTQVANRYGLDVEIYALSDTSMSSPLMTIDFANISEVNITGGRSWATGGQAHVNKIGFNDPVQGTFKLSTQIMTMGLLGLLSGGTAGSGETSVTFANPDDAVPNYYIIKAKTVWQDATGKFYDEVLTFHKACPQRALNITYNGSGDPTSMDVVFDLLQDDDKNVLTIGKSEGTAG